MPLTLVTAPTSDLISLAEAKLQLRIEADVTDEEDLVRGIIAAAVGRCQDVTGRQLLQATWDLTLDAFPLDDVLEVPRPPLQSVTSVTYVDTAGTSQTWAASNYQVDAPTGAMAPMGRIAPAPNVSWPSTREQLNAVTIRFVAGYATAAAVPAALKAGILLLIGHFYMHREAVADGRLAALPLGVQALFRPYHIRATQRAA